MPPGLETRFALSTGNHVDVMMNTFQVIRVLVRMVHTLITTDVLEKV
jgi:hypothetical protein